MAVRGLDHLALTVADVERSLEFYRRALTPGSADLCFRFDAPIEEALRRLAAQGIDLLEGPGPLIATAKSAPTSRGGSEVFWC